MNTFKDGPCSPHFSPLEFQGNIQWEQLAQSDKVSPAMAGAVEHAPRGECVGWGIPFKISEAILLTDAPVTIQLESTQLQWLVFLHTADQRPMEKNASGFYAPMRGEGQLNEHAADYVILYADGSEARLAIRRRHHIGAFEHHWGEMCFQAAAQRKPHPLRASHEQLRQGWGWTQTRAASSDYDRWGNWLFAWENPTLEKAIVGVRFEPVSGVTVIAGLAKGFAVEHPLRWQMRKKAVFFLPEGEKFAPDLDDNGLLAQIQLDLGQVISALPRPLYPNTTWADSYNNQLPRLSESEVLVEYTAHPDACFHLPGGRTLPARQLEMEQPDSLVQPVAAARQRVTLKVIERATGKPQAVKLHLHGEWGEYLAPVDRHRIINPAWFEDYSADFSHRGVHSCTYIPGETVIDLPLGQVFLEISKGFEIRPVRKVVNITAETEEVMIELDKVLPWREKGWVTADTHVHFLSPMTAMLEGAGEGVNIVNLLASQWGELMTNVGDFDGASTWGSRDCGGDGEYLVRVGTENRQHVLGHISLLGYRGRIIAPMTTGGADESALGDPVEILLTEWAQQCHRQGGLVVLPHFPNPRAEYAASIVSGDIDALEMTSWGDLYSGINPYSLSDWYRYLNCGYLVAAVGGTDKMAAETAVGTVRTYARIPTEQPFTYAAWMEAVKRAETFVTYGPLLDFSVEGRPMGSRFAVPANGGRVDVHWQVASVTVPISRVELIVNGEVRESVAVDGNQAAGSWSFKVERSAWLALLVRGGYADRPEIITAHSSPVMIDVEGTQMLAAADAVTILEQIEGALAYLDTVGIRAADRAYKRMRLVLEASQRSLHNRMHQMGHYHDHK